MPTQCLLRRSSGEHVVSHDPTLSRQEGVLLLIDVCIQKDTIGDDGDFFVIAESRNAAQTLQKMLCTYVEDSKIPIRTEVLMVCAAKHGSTEHILVGDKFDAEPRLAPQPLYIEKETEFDRQYIDAISTISTYAFERAATSKGGKEVLKMLRLTTAHFCNQQTS